MIYDVCDIHARFQNLQRCLMRSFKRLKESKAAEASRVKYKKRAIAEVPRDKLPQYWNSSWGQLIQRFAQLEGGPPISSQDGNLFRRRFRLPNGVYHHLVRMCIEKQLFGPYSNEQSDLTGRKICPVEIKLLSVRVRDY